VTGDQGIADSLVHAGRIGELVKAQAAILDGLQEVKDPRPLIYSAVFINAEAAVEVDRLEQAIRGWAACRCEGRPDFDVLDE
jgi:hypothetical protein